MCETLWSDFSFEELREAEQPRFQRFPHSSRGASRSSHHLRTKQLRGFPQFHSTHHNNKLNQVEAIYGLL